MIPLTFMQWNIRGFRANFTDLKRLLSCLNIGVVCLQETKLSPNSPASVKGYSVFRTDLRSDTVAHGGVAIVVNHGIPCMKLTLSTDLQAVAVTVNLGKVRMTICSLYLPPGDSFPKTSLEALIKELPSPFLLLGDFNAHSPVWGCSGTSQRGKRVESFFNNNDLVLLNNGAHTHITLPSGSTSAVDLSVCTPTLASMFSWSVDCDPNGSDHFPIWLRLNAALPGSRPARWNHRRARWAEFTAQSLLDICPTPGDNVTSLIGSVNSTIIAAASDTIPRTSSAPHKNPVPWWTEQCRLAVARKKRALRRFQRSPTTPNLISFKQARAAARRTVREAQRTNWQSYITSINRFTPLTRVWNRVKRISGRGCSTPIPVLKAAGRLLTDTEDVANAFGHAFEERSQLGTIGTTFDRHRRLNERNPVDFSSSNDECYNVKFSLMELQAAMAKTRSTAPGPDDITNDMLTHLSQHSLQSLLDTFNFIWETDSFPTQWTESVIVPILKPNKDGTDALHYRPISLTSCVCKLFERMISTRLMWFLETEGLLANAQCGFRRHRSSVDQLVILDTVVRNAFTRKKHVLAVFFDIEGAFDTTWRQGILMKLHRMGIRGHMGWFLSNFLRDRSFTVRVGNTKSRHFRLANGVPQGGVVSVVLFSVMVNDIGDLLPSHVGRSLFVDDFAIWVTSSTTLSAESQLQHCLDQLSEWSTFNGFRFSTTKSTCVHFCNRRRPCADPRIKLYDTVIPVVRSFKFLGVLLDRRLSYIDHLKTLRTKCFKALDVLKVISHTKYGGDRKTMLTLYRALIRSKIDYACIVYDSACDTSKKMLDSVHSHGVRICTGAFRTSPIASLLIDAHEPPLWTRRRLLALRYAIRISQFSSHPTFPCLFSKDLLDHFSKKARLKSQPLCIRANEWLKSAEVDRHLIQPIPQRFPEPWLLALPCCDTALTKFSKSCTSPVELKQQAQRHISINYSSSTHFYTDGSKTKWGTGCAFVSSCGSEQVSLPSAASIFTAELLAILRCLSHISRLRVMSATIFTDSLSSVLALQNCFNHGTFLTTLISEHFTALQTNGKKITLVWIPSHVGLVGNESADRAAKAASMLPMNPHIYIPATDYNQTAKTYVESEWQKLWDKENLSNKLKTIKPKLGQWESSLRKSRKEEVLLTRLRIGHTFGTHSFLLLRTASPQCSKCGGALTVRHVLIDCVFLHQQRQTMFGGASTLSDLIGEFPEVALPTIVRFLLEADLEVFAK